MNTPACPRCAGTRFFRVLRMRDGDGFINETVKERVSSWKERPVRLEPAHGEAQTPVGHFETLICRRCGHTTWYAREWRAAELTRAARSSPCTGCDANTPHAQLPAIEHAFQRFEHARITHGLLGREGFLHLSICEACDLVSWRGDDYAHLESRHFVHYRMVKDEARPCLSCRSVDAIVDEDVREYDGVEVPIAVLRENARTLYRWFGMEEAIGHFAIRVCRPCGSVEWYGRDLDNVKPDQHAGILAVGDEPVSQGGPYR